MSSHNKLGVIYQDESHTSAEIQRRSLCCEQWGSRVAPSCNAGTGVNKAEASPAGQVTAAKARQQATIPCPWSSVLSRHRDGHLLAELLSRLVGFQKGLLLVRHASARPLKH